ncbi:hypothetical protein, partial [Vibrio cholerae]|uniref:hypothetical protein n=1 Tax=Vibrio cholerae TaxID=666 RepID=UPI001C3EDC6E
RKCHRYPHRNLYGGAVMKKSCLGHGVANDTIDNCYQLNADSPMLSMTMLCTFSNLVMQDLQNGML